MASQNAEFDRKNKLVTSWLFSPTILAGLRILLAFYALVTLLVDIIWSSVKDHDAEQFLSFFTNLTYIGICAYFFASGVQTFFFARNTRRGTPDATYPLKTWPRFSRHLHILLLTTITTYPILVTIVFWILLASSATFSTAFSSWSNISKHALNSAFALFEIIFTNIGPSPWLNLVPTVLILALYLGLAYLTKATQGFYTYSFLDPKAQGKKLAAYIVGILVGHILVFLIVLGIVKLRERLTKGKGEQPSGLLSSSSEKKSGEETAENA